MINECCTESYNYTIMNIILKQSEVDSQNYDLLCFYVLDLYQQIHCPVISLGFVPFN